MFGKRRLEQRCRELEYKVRELEELSCPHNSHRYIQIDVRWLTDYMGESYPVYIYECEKCHKRMESMNYC